MNEGKADVAVVVASLDEYSDVWPGFFDLWFRFWPDMPYQLYLISNRRTFPDSRVIPLTVGEGLTWSQRMERALTGLPHRHILFSTEDFFLLEPADTAHVVQLHDAMIAENAPYLRLMPGPQPYIPHPSLPDVGIVEKGTPYRGAGQLSFWDRQMMLDSLRPDESAAEWERQGTARSDQIKGAFLTVRDGVVPVNYHNVIRGGKWNRDAIRDFAKRGITFDVSKRPVQSSFDVWWHTPSPSRRALSTCKHIVMRALGKR